MLTDLIMREDIFNQCNDDWLFWAEYRPCEGDPPDEFLE